MKTMFDESLRGAITRARRHTLGDLLCRPPLAGHQTTARRSDHRTMARGERLDLAGLDASDACFLVDSRRGADLGACQRLRTSSACCAGLLCV
jgi:hypothetical protein